MNLNNYLHDYQQVVYQTLINQFEKGTISHAYLLSGNQGVPLIEVATFFAKSLVCTSLSPLACDNCLECSRIENHSNIDFLVFDGAKSSIKKEEILQLEKAFASTSNEKSNKLIYIINLVEKMSSEAINAILKFLEEPSGNVFAILTTNNIERVLPTIISRCQRLVLKLIPRENVIKAAISKGMEESEAELLALIYNNPEQIVMMSKSEEYQQIKRSVFSVLNEYCHSLARGIVEANIQVNSNLKDKNAYYNYLLIISTFIKDIVNYNYNNKLLLPSQKELIIKLATQIKNPLRAYGEINSVINQIDLNVNIGLINDHINNYIN